MEKEPSQSAIAAIAALQNRVRELETEEQLLNEEKQRCEKKIMMHDKGMEERCFALDNASEKVKIMLSYINTTMQDLQVAREANQELKRNLEDYSSNPLSKDEKLKKASQKREMKTEVTYLLEIVRQYEDLLSQVLSPSNVSSNFGKPDGVDDLMKEIINLPQSISDNIVELKSLPKVFLSQKISIKRRIVQALCQAKSLLTNLEFKVKKIEEEKVSSASPQRLETEIIHLKTYHTLILEEIKKFQFSKEM